MSEKALALFFLAMVGIGEWVLIACYIHWAVRDLRSRMRGE